MNISVPNPNFIIINKDEYTKLLDDNNELRTKLLMQANTQEIKNNEKIIEEITNENIMLKNKFNKIEKQIELINTDNIQLKQEIIQIIQDHTEFKKNNNNIIVKIEHIESQKLYNKLLIAIQDMNLIFKLDEIHDTYINNLFKSIIANRFGNINYMNINENKTVIDAKLYVFNERLVSINTNKYIKKKFDKHYKGLIYVLLLYINNMELKDINKDELETANEWWEYN